MKIETDRLIVRSIEKGDEIAYAEMAKDGSLEEIGFDEKGIALLRQKGVVR